MDDNKLELGNLMNYRHHPILSLLPVLDNELFNLWHQKYIKLPQDRPSEQHCIRTDEIGKS